MFQIALSVIPAKPWVYVFKWNKDSVLYIGKAKNLKNRVTQYFQKNSFWKQEMLNKAQSLDFFEVKSEWEALYLEDNLIKKYQPPYNSMLKWSNSYVYVKITLHPFPQVYLTRKRVSDGSLYIGPKHNTIHLKKFLQYIRQVLQYRTCTNTVFNQKKVCWDYYFGLCKWWCEKAKLQEKFNSEFEPEIYYKKMMQKIASFFRWNTWPIEQELLQQINIASKNQNFEWAAKLRDIYTNIASFVERQTVVLDLPLCGYIFEIREIGNYYVYVVLNFFEGKLIDIIVNKQSMEDLDLASLFIILENELGKFTVENLSDRDVFWSTFNLKKLTIVQKREVLDLMNKFFESYLISNSFKDENLLNNLLSSLQKRYSLKKFPYRIECIDISHLSGGRTSGGLSALVWWIPYNKYYRRYKIKSDPSDDYAALLEVVSRRFSRIDDLPDLFILDWGKWQLSVIKKLLLQKPSFRDVFDKIDIVSLWKWEARKKSTIGFRSQKQEKNMIWEKLYFFDWNLTIKSIDLIYDQVDALLLKVRDEAHRFANKYRKKQMKDEWK